MTASARALTLLLAAALLGAGAPDAVASGGGSRPGHARRPQQVRVRQPRRPARLGAHAARGRLPRRALPTGPGRFEQHAVGGKSITVYLPPGYDALVAAGHEFPVLILQDAQNLFGAGAEYGSWNVEHAIDTEVQAGRVEPVIVLAVPHSYAGRIPEYTMNADPEHGGGGGAAYIRYVADVLHPWAERTFPLRPGREHTAIGGSSLGARISLEAHLERPEIFGKVLAHSPSVWFNDKELLKRVESTTTLPAGEIYIDSGGSGSSNDDAGNVFALRDALLARNFDHGDWNAPGRRASRRLWHWFEPGHGHTESAWRERFPRALRALFPAD